MHWPGSRPALLRLLLVVVLGTLTGCSAYLSEEGDPRAPVLVQGRVVDASGGGMSGAEILVQVPDHARGQVGDTVPLVYEGRFRAGLDGAFVVRLAPTPALTAFAGGDGGSVSFSLYVFAEPVEPFSFSRELRAGAWVGEVPTFVFGPDGVTEQGAEPREHAALLAGI
jgi:hypothetical protein